FDDPVSVVKYLDLEIGQNRLYFSIIPILFFSSEIVVYGPIYYLLIANGISIISFMYLGSDLIRKKYGK
ncbi:hypothetical protein PENTCL1PPCAC_5459, partial [Pristionchus entomophagus]